MQSPSSLLFHNILLSNSSSSILILSFGLSRHHPPLIPHPLFHIIRSYSSSAAALYHSFSFLRFLLIIVPILSLLSFPVLSIAPLFPLPPSSSLQLTKQIDRVSPGSEKQKDSQTDKHTERKRQSPTEGQSDKERHSARGVRLKRRSRWDSGGPTPTLSFHLIGM